MTLCEWDASEGHPGQSCVHPHARILSTSFISVSIFSVWCYSSVLYLNGNARKVELGPGKLTQKHGLVWRNRNKISQIIKDYFYLPFFLLIIL
jgi:hypothetical protein